MNHTVSSVISLVLGVLLVAGQANAQFTDIPQPDEDYQESTMKIELPDVPDNTELEGITDGTLAVLFTSDSPVCTRPSFPVPGSRRILNSESATPAVLVARTSP